MITENHTVLSILRICAIVTLFSLSSVSNASAHIDTISTSPSESEIVDVTPNSIELKFTEKIDLRDITISLFNSDSESIPLTGNPQVASDGTVFFKPPTLEEGSYAIVWGHKGLDAHVATGQVVFSVGVPSQFESPIVIKEDVNAFNVLTKNLIYLAFILLLASMLLGVRYRQALLFLAIATVLKFTYLASEARTISEIFTTYPSNVGWCLLITSLLVLAIKHKSSKLPKFGVFLYSLGIIMSGHLPGRSLYSLVTTMVGYVHLVAMLYWLTVLLVIGICAKSGSIAINIKSLVRFIPFSVAASALSGVFLYFLRTKDTNSEMLISTLSDNYGMLLIIKLVLIIVFIFPIASVVKSSINKGKVTKLVIVEFFLALLVVLLGVVLSSSNSNSESIVKTDSLFTVPERAVACMESNGYYTQNCLIRYVRKNIATKSAESILTELAELRKSNKEFLTMCHGVTHALGRSAYVKYGSIAEGFKNGYDVCDFGYYHGVVEGAGRMLTDAEFVTKMPNFCNSLLEEGRQELAEQCIHGLGHAAALRVNNDLQRGLAMCDSMDSIQKKYQDIPVNLMCGTGVTMEWFTNASEAFKFGRPEIVVPAVTDPKDACYDVPDKWKASCVEYAPNNATGKDISTRLGVSDYCSSFTGYAKERCFWGLGRVSFDGVNGSGINDTWKICTKHDDIAAQESCLEGAGTMAVIVQNDKNNAQLFCKLFEQNNFVSSDKVCSRLERNAKAIVDGTGDGKLKLDQESVGLFLNSSEGK